jgi:hypothetical protein
MPNGEVAMLMKEYHPSELINHVAIVDKELLKTSSFRTETFELCTVCGARFGIGYFGESMESWEISEQIEGLELPQRLIEILAKDHRRKQEHKDLIELDV